MLWPKSIYPPAPSKTPAEPLECADMSALSPDVTCHVEPPAQRALPVLWRSPERSGLRVPARSPVRVRPAFPKGADGHPKNARPFSDEADHKFPKATFITSEGLSGPRIPASSRCKHGFPDLQ